MKKIIATLATAAVLGGTTLAVTPPVSATIAAYPLCVQSEPDNGWAAWIIDEESDLVEASRFVTAPFPSEQGLGGCSFYHYNPPQFKDCPTVDVSPDNAVVPRLRAKLAHKNAVIASLRAKLAAR